VSVRGVVAPSQGHSPESRQAGDWRESESRLHEPITGLMANSPFAQMEFRVAIEYARFGERISSARSESD
jgi:hypothetical protein